MKSKSIIYMMVLILLGVSIQIVRAIEPDTQQEAIKKNKEMQAKQLIIAAIEKLERQSIEKEALKNQIIRAPSEHRNKETSRRLLRDWSKEELRISLETPWEEIYKAINKDKKDKDWISREELKGLVNGFERKIESTIETVLNRKFPDAFQDARASAVKVQWETMKQGIYPEVSEVEEIDKKGDYQKVKAKLKKDMAGKIPLLEENEQALDQTIDGVIGDALRQLRGQRNVVRKSKAKGITEDGISGNMRIELRKFIDQQEKSPGRKIYDIFPSVNVYLSERASELMKQRFQEYVSSDKIDSFIDENNIERLIRNNLPKHREFEKSLKILRKDLGYAIKNTVIASYSAKVLKEVRGEFQAILQGLMEGDEKIRQAYENNVKYRLKNAATNVRNNLAKQQLANYFPKIVSKEWEVPENEIKEYKNNHRIIGVDSVINLLGVSIERSRLLQETEQQLDNVVGDMLDEGLTAFRAQIDVVEEKQKDIEEKIREDKGKHKSNHWQNIYVDIVKAYWKEERIKRIWGEQPFQTYMEKKYSSLFDDTTTRIRQIIQDILEKVDMEIEIKRQAEIAVSEDRKKDTGNESGGGSDNGGSGGRGSGGGGGGGGGGGSGGKGGEFVRIHVISIPEGGGVFFNDDDRGVTPVTIDKIRPGDYELRIVMPNASNEQILPNDSPKLLWLLIIISSLFLGSFIYNIVEFWRRRHK